MTIIKTKLRTNQITMASLVDDYNTTILNFIKDVNSSKYIVSKATKKIIRSLNRKD